MSVRRMWETEDLLVYVRAALLAFPHLRVGQLLCNVVDTPTDLFYVSDDLLILRLQDYVAKHTDAT
jgi:hypothetical protein